MKILLTQELATQDTCSVKESIRFTEMEPAFSAELNADFQVRRVQETLFRLEGNLQGTVTTCCDRCCKEIEFAVNHGYGYSLQLGEEPLHASEYNGTDEDCEILYLQEAVVESDDIIKEQILLAIPEFILCVRDCKGICDRCGINLNEKSCKCGEVNENSPFAILKDLKNK